MSLARFQLRNARTELAVAEGRVERLARAADDKRRGLQVTEDDLIERVAELEGRRARRVERRRRLETEVERARSTWRTARDDDSPAARVAALHARLVALEREIEILDMRGSDLTMAIEAWAVRYRLAAGEPSGCKPRSSAGRASAASPGARGCVGSTTAWRP